MRVLIIVVPVCVSLLSGCAGTTRVVTETLVLASEVVRQIFSARAIQ